MLALLACQLGWTTLVRQLLIGFCGSLISLVVPPFFVVSNCLVGQCKLVDRFVM